ncbi:MAG TPA: hypothetical protein DEV87_06435 [Clostridiales bacterium]|nr:hypothetical protein [Clostridiales bacterium]
MRIRVRAPFCSGGFAFLIGYGLTAAARSLKTVIRRYLSEKRTYSSRIFSIINIKPLLSSVLINFYCRFVKRFSVFFKFFLKIFDKL